MAPITRTIPLSKIVSYNVNVDIRAENGEWIIHHYTPEGNDIYIFQLDAASEALLKQKRTQMETFLNQQVTLSGEVKEHWQKKMNTTTVTKEEWVMV